MAHSYTVTAHKPTAVNACVTGEATYQIDYFFTTVKHPNLVVVSLSVCFAIWVEMEFNILFNNISAVSVSMDASDGCLLATLQTHVVLCSAASLECFHKTTRTHPVIMNKPLLY